MESPEKAAPNWYAVKGYEDYTTGQFGLSLNFNPGQDKKFSVATFGSMRDADELRPFNKLIEQSQYSGLRANFQKSFFKGTSEHTLITGIEVFRERYNWSTVSNENEGGILSDNHEKRSYENIFLQFESEIKDKLYFSTGLNSNLTRFIYNDRFLKDGDQSGSHKYKPIISPRFGVSYILSPSISFFGNLSHGFSTPTFEETLLPQGQINPEIKPETGWNTEIGMRMHSSERFQGSVSYYRIHINNLLVARRTGEDAYMGVNAGKSLHPGLEAELRLSLLPPGSVPSLIFNGNITLTNYHFLDFTDNDNDYSGNALPGTPDNTWLASVNFKPVKNIEFTAWHRHAGKMYLDDANSDYSKQYGITNIQIRLSFKTKLTAIGLKTGIMNIFDVRYASMLAINAPGFGGNLPRYYYPGDPRNSFLSVVFNL
jgi:iron complex outermembrane receptor protein